MTGLHQMDPPKFYIFNHLELDKRNFRIKKLLGFPNQLPQKLYSIVK